MQTRKKLKRKAQKKIDKTIRAYKTQFGYVPNYVKTLASLDEKVFVSYHGLRDIVYKDGYLTKKEKQLIVLAINIIRNYQYGIELHVKAAKIAGASENEIFETICCAIFSGAALPLIEGVNTLTKSKNK